VKSHEQYDLFSSTPGVSSHLRTDRCHGCGSVLPSTSGIERKWKQRPVSMRAKRRRSPSMYPASGDDNDDYGGKPRLVGRYRS